ncbi:hypothetical protein [Nocardia brasiliensis]|uniref:hypothetical protein n=1 Tax=Nocardia brasiliensis TaxID=37326 RepID=UPI0024579703|nr:hypothetical protein [Nocardia brasiliensis]
MAAIDADGGRATRVVAWNQLRASRSVHHIGPEVVGPVAIDDVLSYEHLTVSFHRSGPRPNAMPLALLAPAEEGWLIYLPIRLGEIDTLFHRVDVIGPRPDRRRPPASEVLATVCERLPAYSKHAGSHECWYFTVDPDIEYEHKITLDPDLDIYTLTRDIKKLIGRGELGRYRSEYRNDFELWQFDNHMFDVTGPAESDRGYASFIPRLNGGYTVKRKQFAEDGFARIEKKLHYPHELDGTEAMGSYLTDQLNLDARYLGSFHRIRFDDMLESAETGHIYSLMTDRCVFDHAAVLQQLEIEYINSRGDARECRPEIIAELDHLKGWTTQFLAGRGIPARLDYTSKYTFLRRLIETGHDRRENTALDGRLLPNQGRAD